MILITAGGAKGAAPRDLARKVARKLADGAAILPPDAVSTLRTAQRCANKLIPLAPRGAEVVVQLTLEQDPLGGWSAGVIVSSSPPPQRRPS